MWELLIAIAGSFMDCMDHLVFLPFRDANSLVSFCTDVLDMIHLPVSVGLSAGNGSVIVVHFILTVAARLEERDIALGDRHILV